MSLSEILEISVPEQAIARIPLKVPMSDLPKVMGPGILEILAVLNEQGIAPAGPWLTYHRCMPGEMTDFDIGVPVNSPISPNGRVLMGTLPAARVAWTNYQGPYEGLGEAWGKFIGAVAAKGWQGRGDFWEVYAKGPESGADSSQYLTRLNLILA